MDLLKLLSSYTPISSEEIIYKKQMIEFYQRYPNCFSRQNTTGHFTASAWVINPAMDSFLLLHHKKLDAWYQPGGHADENANLLEVAIQETYEETGIKDPKILLNGEIFDIDVHIIPKNKEVSEHLHLDVRFLLQARTEDIKINEKEANDLRWFGINDEKNLPNKALAIIRMINKHKDYLKTIFQASDKI